MPFDLSKVMGYKRPRNDTDPRTAMGEVIAPFVDAVELDVVMKFDDAGDRNGKITVDGAGGTRKATEGMLGWVRSARRLDVLDSIANGVLVWREYEPISYVYNESNFINVGNNGQLPAGADIGAFTPTADRNNKYGRGANGPIVPVDGTYSGVLTVSVTLDMNNADGTPCRGWANVTATSRPDITWRNQCGYGDNIWGVPFGPVRMAAGDQFGATVRQNSSRGQMNGCSVRWDIAKVARG